MGVFWGVDRGRGMGRALTVLATRSILKTSGRLHCQPNGGFPFASNTKSSAKILLSRSSSFVLVPYISCLFVIPFMACVTLLAVSIRVMSMEFKGFVLLEEIIQITYYFAALEGCTSLPQLFYILYKVAETNLLYLHLSDQGSSPL